MLLLLACTEPRSSFPAEIPDVVDTGETAELIDHCGTIVEDEVWLAGRKHRVTCDIEVERGILTIGAGADVQFEELTGLKVGKSEYEAGLIVDGSTAGVTMRAASEAGWEGIDIGSFATTVNLAGLTMRDGAGGLSVSGAMVSVEGLGIDGASGAGLTLEAGARFADGATGVVVTGSGDWGVRAEVATAHTLPDIGSAYTGNGFDGAYLAGDFIDTEVEWENLGVPYVVSENVEVSGNVGEPAVLTVGPGVTVLFEHDRQLQFSRTGSASQLVVNGTAEAPVVFDALGADTAGYWRGIDVATGASPIELHYVSIFGAGEVGGAALFVEGTTLLVEQAWFSGSAGAGVMLGEGASFHPDSVGLAVSNSALALELPAGAVGSLPVDGLSLTGNTTAAVKVSGDTEVATSGLWLNPGIPYWVADDIEVDGTAENPVVLEIGAGVQLRFDNDTGLFVGKRGSAGLIVSGTAEAPVTMLPWSAEVAGAWSGLGIYDASLDDTVVIDHLEIGYGGGASLKGNLHVDDAAPQVNVLNAHHSLEWGVYLAGDAAPVLSEIVYEANLSGECNACL